MKVSIAGADELILREASVLIFIETNEAGRGVGLIAHVRDEFILREEAVLVLIPTVEDLRAVERLLGFGGC